MAVTFNTTHKHSSIVEHQPTPGRHALVLPSQVCKPTARAEVIELFRLRAFTIVLSKAGASSFQGDDIFLPDLGLYQHMPCQRGEEKREGGGGGGLSDGLSTAPNDSRIKAEQVWTDGGGPYPVKISLWFHQFVICCLKQHITSGLQAH